MPPPPTPTPAVKPLAWFVPDERELARHDDADAVVRMGRDLVANGQLQAVAALDTGRLVFGHGRYLAAKAAGIETLRADVYPAALTARQVGLIRAAENLTRTELTTYQRYEIVAAYLADTPGAQMKDAAADLHLDPATVTKLMAVGRVPEPVVAALKAGRIGLGDLYAIARAGGDDKKLGLLHLKLGGASRDEVQRAAKSQRGGDAPAVRLARVRMTVNDLSLVLSGAELSLDDVASALAEAQKEVRRCQGQGMDVRALNALQSARKAAG